MAVVAKRPFLKHDIRKGHHILELKDIPPTEAMTKKHKNPTSVYPINNGAGPA
jgi:hypothetical protein